MKQETQPDIPLTATAPPGEPGQEMPTGLAKYAVASTPPSSQKSGQKSGAHLDFLDGIRGLAAVYVLLYHCYLLLLYANGDPSAKFNRIMGLLRPLSFGHYAVDMFIVLSGYCLMLPLARRDETRLTGGFGSYIQRRARRILPPYYAALILSLLLAFITLKWAPQDNTAYFAPNWFFGAGNLASHFLLVHNLFLKWSYAINGPLWSVATEWQIYFLFPLLLLPLWKRCGYLLTPIVAYLMGTAAHFLAPTGLAGAAPWFLGLFALGMAGAAINFHPATQRKLAARHIPWGWLSGLILLALVAAGAAKPGYFVAHLWLIDPLFGLAAMCLLVYCAQSQPADGTQARPVALRAVQSRVAMRLGAFSYSLYLTHFPLLGIAHLLLKNYAVAPLLRIVLVFGVCAPAALALAYLFHLAFERPFLLGAARASAQPAPARR